MTTLTALLSQNLETQARPSKKLNKRKDTFIEILHRIQVKGIYTFSTPTVVCVVVKLMCVC